MSAGKRARCPVCHNPVAKTTRGNIGGHFDKANKPCEASGYPYEITLRSVA